MKDSGNDNEVTLRIVVMDPPCGVRFQLQRGAKALDPPTSTNSKAITFEFPVRIGKRPDGQPNVLGPNTQGPPAGRFVYVNSGTLAGQSDTCWSRRAKVPLTSITWALIERARRGGVAIEVEITGTGRDGGPSCGTVRLQPGAWRVSQPV